MFWVDLPGSRALRLRQLRTVGALGIFGAVEMDSVRDCFRTRDVVDLLKISRRQLQYWAQTGLVEPSVKTPGGHSRYTFEDLVALKAAKVVLVFRDNTAFDAVSGQEWVFEVAKFGREVEAWRRSVATLPPIHKIQPKERSVHARTA